MLKPIVPEYTIKPVSQKIFLVGLMGAGKTTIGKKLAAKLQLPFLDLDDLIEQQEQKPVHEIFAKEGESYFRKIESELLQKTIQENESFVLATGGGTPCFFTNSDIMKNSGICVWLDPPLSEILKRLQKENVLLRPVLENKSGEALKEYLKQLYIKRSPFYKQAHLHFTTNKVPVTSLLRQVTNFLLPKT